VADDDLTARQEKAVLAVLAAKSYAAAARQAGVSETTLHEWLRLPAFQSKLREARTRLIDRTVTALAQTATDAVAALKRNLRAKGNPGVQVRAAVELDTTIC
jgi:DNA-binding phage protein